MESTIAEDFLNDLNDLSDDDLPTKYQKVEKDEEGISILEESKLLHQQELSEHILRISSQDQNSLNYDLITKSNEFIMKIDIEIAQLHKYLKDLYLPNFRELEDLIQNPLDFSKILIKFTLESPQEADISSIVPNHIIIAIAMAIAHSPPKPIKDEIKMVVLKIAKQIIELHDAKTKMLGYIEERMTKIAPSLSTLLGTAVAGKIISAVGGLDKLAEMPACNIQVLGIEHGNALGMSALGTGKHKGFLAQVDLAKNAGRDQKKVIRMLAAKSALASRYDLFNKNNDGALGRELLGNITSRFEKSIEPPINNQRKPLPIPIDIKKPHRGGRRIRAAKRKYELTEIRKFTNRVPFGVEEQEEFRDTGHTFGALASTNKLKVKLAGHQNYKLSAKRNQQLKNSESGLASIYAFDNNTELKLDNPISDVFSVSSKYFDSKSGFSTVIAEKLETNKK